MSGQRFLPESAAPYARHDRAGAGLSSAQARQRFGRHADVGAAGERKFADLVKAAGLDVAYDVFYSLGLPSRGAGRQYNSDVDAALANGSHVVLVDVKRWKANAFYWSISGLPFKGLTPLVMSGKWGLSANMAAAVRKYREALPGVDVTAMVVFVPSGRGELPVSVRWLRWPGGIRSFTSANFAPEVRRRLGVERQPASAKVVGLLRSMQRG